MEEILRQLENARIIDLAQPYYVGMPHHPAHPPYLFGMTKTHGEYTMGKASSAAESIALGGHVGTHIDALSLFSLCGKLYGGIDAVQNQSYSTGLQKYDVDTIEPIFSRAVLLDIVSTRGSMCSPLISWPMQIAFQRSPKGRKLASIPATLF